MRSSPGRWSDSLRKDVAGGTFRAGAGKRDAEGPGLRALVARVTVSLKTRIVKGRTSPVV